MCSKMSQLHAELTMQAAELGYESIEEAEANGYTVDYDKQKLVNAQEEAHKEWLKERERIIKKLEICAKALEQDGFGFRAEAIEDAINFIKKGEC